MDRTEVGTLPVMSKVYEQLPFCFPQNVPKVLKTFGSDCNTNQIKLVKARRPEGVGAGLTVECCLLLRCGLRCRAYLTIGCIDCQHTALLA